MSLQAAAQRKFKGKYKGPDRFKGNKEAIAAWKAEGKPTSTDKGTKPVGTVSTNLETMPKITPNPEADKKYGQLTKVYKGKYIGADKYKGIAQKGKHKGKYIGIDSRKGQAKPSTDMGANLDALRDAYDKDGGWHSIMIIDVDLPTVHDNGMFISAKVSRIVELIREYDHRLDVKWVPPNMRGDNDPAFAITESLSDGREVVAFYVQSEADFNENVLARIYEGDNTKGDVQARITAQNAAVTRVREARQREEREQYYEVMASMIRSGKHTYRHNGRKYDL